MEQVRPCNRGKYRKVQYASRHMGRLRRHVEENRHHLHPTEPFHQNDSRQRAISPWSFLPEKHKPQMSYMGSHSGRDENKYEGSGLHPLAIGDAAGIEEADLIFVCKKIYTAEMTPSHYTDKSAYDEWNTGRRAGNNHNAYIGEVIKISEEMKTTAKTSFPVSAGEIKKTPPRLFIFLPYFTS